MERLQDIWERELQTYAHLRPYRWFVITEEGVVRISVSYDEAKMRAARVTHGPVLITFTGDPTRGIFGETSRSLSPITMARTVPAHKANFTKFIDPDYAKVPEVSGWEIAKTFEIFNQQRLDEFPDDRTPKDPYMYNTHMGAYVRALDEAKDHFLKGRLAFYAARGSGSPTQ
jgi:hypothetical protein